MSDSTIERLESNAKHSPDVLITVYPGDVMEYVNALRARIAELEMPKTCATCKSLKVYYDGFLWCDEDKSEKGEVNEPSNFGCIHHAPKEPTA